MGLPNTLFGIKMEKLKFPSEEWIKAFKEEVNRNKAYEEGSLTLVRSALRVHKGDFSTPYKYRHAKSPSFPPSGCFS